MSNYLLERDSLRGAAGTIYLDIDDVIYDVPELKNFSIDTNFNEVDFKVVGANNVQVKTTGAAITGSFTLYTGSPIWLEMVKRFLDDGILTYFTIQVVNNDQTSTIGRQIVSFQNCKISSITNMVTLDADADFLTSDYTFSCTGYEIIESFVTPANYGVNNMDI